MHVYNYYILIDLFSYYITSFLVSCFWLNSIFSDRCVAILTFFFLFLLSCINFSISSPWVYAWLNVKWVSCKQHIIGSFFFLNSAILCFLIDDFNPFTSGVIFDTYGVMKAILLIAFWLSFLLFLFVLCLSLFHKLVIFNNGMLGFVSVFYVSTQGFCSVVFLWLT